MFTPWSERSSYNLIFSGSDELGVAQGARSVNYKGLLRFPVVLNSHNQE